ncbi:MAG: heme o synthase [Candidatus Nitrosocaldaceae archaeon]
MQRTSIRDDLRSYWEVTKPKIWYLLVFTALISTFISERVNNVSVSIIMYLLVFGSVTAGSAAANTLTSYIDRDIDAIMERTKHRPIPSGRIKPNNALYYGLSLTCIALILAWLINVYAFALMIFGLFDNIIVYSKWLKRRSASNIILGGFSGGAPALIGYVAASIQNIELGLILAGLVFLWTPTHIWSLAMRVKDDYARAKVPMLPVVMKEDIAIRIISIATLIMVVFSILPVFWGYFNIIYLVTSIVLGVIISVMSIVLVIKPTPNRSWQLFKFSSPYLTIIFIFMAIDAAIHM